MNQGIPVQMLQVNNGLRLAQNGQPVAVIPRNPAASGKAADAPAATPKNNGTVRGTLVVPVNPIAVGQPSLVPLTVAPSQLLQGNPALGSVPGYLAMPRASIQLPPPPAPAPPVRMAPGVARYQAFSDKPGPPPGTLGKTYLRPTRLIAWDKHPRIGMLDVEVLDSMRVGLAHDVKIKVITQDIYNNNKPLVGYFGEDSVWHFESDPLLPVVPHIYDIRFELIRERRVQEMRYGRMFERIIEDKLGTIGIRRVRLIPGRIVDLILY
jgi:hypothetical protein